MSLIGDALKRTQQNTSRPSPRPQPLRKAPVTHSSPLQASLRNPMMNVVVGLSLALVVAGVAYWRLKSVFAERSKAISEVTATPPKQAPKAPEPVTLPPPAIPDTVKEIVRGAKVETPKVEPVAPPPTPPPAPPSPPRELPKLVLQGVTIHGGLREALINGQIVGIGDEVDGVKVVAIEPNKVKLKFDGRDVTLTFAR